MKKLILAIALISTPALAQDRVSKFDKNNDSVVDFGELTLNCEVSQGLFKAADKNGDGVLSNKEMRQARAYLFDKCRKEKKD